MYLSTFGSEGMFSGHTVLAVRVAPHVVAWIVHWRLGPSCSLAGPTSPTAESMDDTWHQNVNNAQSIQNRP